MKFILTVIFSFVFLVSGFSQTRNVVVGTNDVIVQPTNFWSANASNGRTGLGLGSAATNPASAFQPSSSVLSNLASSNGASLTNISVSNVVGALSTNGSAAGLTNITAANITGSIAINNGGTGATNIAGARINLGLDWSALTNTNAATSLLGFTTNGQVVANTGTNVLTFTNAIAFTTNAKSQTIDNLGLYTSTLGGATDADGLFDSANGETTLRISDSAVFLRPEASESFRTNLGFSTNLNTLWTATNASNARSAVGLGETNTPTFRRLVVDPNTSGALGVQYGNNDSGIYNGATYNILSLRVGGINALTADTNGVTFANSATTRTNLGLGWSALTNTNTSGFNASLYGSNTNPVLVNSNGSVVSPTNFWEVAPIQTLVQDFTGVTVSQTNNATNARNVYIYSLATNVSGISNTIILPTNTSTFNGDEVCVIHKGTTNTTTVVRQAGSTNNFITLNRFDESVKFIRELGQWDFYHNISFVEPIQFSGTNAAANVAASRTNLGLGWSALTNTNSSTSLLGFTTNGTVVANTGTNVLTFTNDVKFANGELTVSQQVISGSAVSFSFEDGALSGTINLETNSSIVFQGASAATTRTNLGLPLAALTNTNNATFQQAIFTTNAAPTNAGNFGDHVAWMGVSIVTNGVTNEFSIPLYK